MKNILKLGLVLVLFISSLMTFAQQAVISGKVTDQNGTGFPGVAVVFKGTSIGTVTDAGGVYSLNKSSDVEILSFSFIGMKTKEVNVNGKSVIDVVLETKSVGLEEVVAIGYGTMRKADLTGSVVTVSSEALTKVAATNLGQVLQGRATGVQVTQANGEPGSGSTVKIRGVGSLLSDNSPLILVNGFESSLDNIDPNNIESMVVLKDASSASIYGARAANGVILITTKTGGKGKMTVTIKSEAGFQSMTQTPNFLGPRDYAERRNEYTVNTSDADAPFSANTVLPEDIEGGTDWLKDATRNALTHNHHLNISGGGATSGYTLGIGYTKQDGVVVGTEFNRYNIRLDVFQKVGKKVKIGANLSTYRRQYLAPLSNSGRELFFAISRTSPTLPAYDLNGTKLTPEEARAIPQTPDFYLKNYNNVSKSNNVTVNAYAQVEIIKGLSYKLALSGSNSNTNSKRFKKNYLIYNFAKPSEPPVKSPPADLSQTSSVGESWSLQNTLTYKLNSSGNSLTVLLGQSARESSRESMSVNAYGFSSNDLQVLSAAETVGKVRGNLSESSLWSLFARLSYDYNKKYLLQANIRRDGTSVFAPGKEYGVFPSGSIGWRVSKEKFLENSKVVSNFMLRFGYGVLGNARIPHFSWLNKFDVSSTTTIGDGQEEVKAYQILELSNPKVKWESTTSANLGIDLSLFDNKLRFSADIYDKKTTDMLLRSPVSPSTGFKLGSVLNLGEVQNKGWEAVVSYDDNIKEIDYGLSFNISRNTNKLISLGNAPGSISEVSIIKEGLPLGAYWGYKTEGIWKTKEEIQENPSIRKAAPGALRFVDISGPDGTPDGVINDHDKTVIGSNIPDFIFGFNFNASYKGFDVSVFFQGEANKDMAIQSSFGGLGTGRTENVGQYYHDNRAILDENGNVSGGGQFPAIGRAPSSSIWSDFNIQDVSYVRMKNMQLGYTLNSRISTKLGIKSLRFYLNLTNPVLWTSYKGYDPEFEGARTANGGRYSRGGGDYYPQAKTTSLGIKLSF